MIASLIEIPPMTEVEIRSLLANCEFGDAVFEAMTVSERGVSPRDVARAKLEVALIRGHAAHGAVN